MSEHAEHGEHGATDASNNWLGNKLARWTGHAALTVGGELFTQYGMIATPFVIATLIAGTPAYLPLLAASAIGATIGWQGAKHASVGEKSIYSGIKLAAPFAILGGLPAMQIASGLSLVSTALAMRHRK